MTDLVLRQARHKAHHSAAFDFRTEDRASPRISLEWPRTQRSRPQIRHAGESRLGKFRNTSRSRFPNCTVLTATMIAGRARFAGCVAPFELPACIYTFHTINCLERLRTRAGARSPLEPDSTRMPCGFPSGSNDPAWRHVRLSIIILSADWRRPDFLACGDGRLTA